jgi:hypothetical protein
MTCTCGVTKRVKISSAVFLTLPQQKLAHTLASLSAEGLLQTVEERDCYEGCKTAYFLNPEGEQALGVFLAELRTWGLAGFRRAEEVSL